MLLYDFQKLIYNLLSSNAELESKLVDISDTIDEDAPYPYILIGEDEETSKGTKVNKGCEIVSNIEIWSDKDSFAEVKQLIETIEGILETANMDINAYKCIKLKTENDVYADKENQLKKGLIQIQIEYLESN